MRNCCSADMYHATIQTLNNDLANYTKSVLPDFCQSFNEDILKQTREEREGKVQFTSPNFIRIVFNVITYQ